ncbi:hypothetical protein F5X97DRAFT_326412 [Nemania serpens]|nr:hypothetical protein F5X97DRAFT_326412 [Nemania serpens]
MASPYALQETPSEQGISAGRSTHFHTAPNTATTAVQDNQSQLLILPFTVICLDDRFLWLVGFIIVKGCGVTPKFFYLIYVSKYKGYATGIGLLEIMPFVIRAI